MSDLNIIEHAIRTGVRYQTSKGLVTTEDLWNIPLPDLKVLARNLYRTVKEEDEDELPSILQTEKPSGIADLNRLRVIMHVISEREKEIAERRAISEAAEKEKARKEYILKILEKKKMESLEGLSADELRKLLDSLDLKKLL